MNMWYLILPCLILLIAISCIIIMLYILKRKGLTSEKTNEELNLIKKNYRIVGIIMGVLALISFCVAICFIAILKWIGTGIAVIVGTLTLTVIASFCYGKYKTISIRQNHNK